MNTQYDVLIVGAGHAGAQAAISLRQSNFVGSIGLVGDEPSPPYDRPPLSKEYLAGTKPFERMLIRSDSFWKERNIDLLLGRRIVSIDADAHIVTADDGRVLGFGKLLWATGGQARTLSCPGSELGGIHTIRKRSDTDGLIAELPGTEHVVVVGGGYIGLEAAASLRKMGKEVTIVETLDRVLARVTSPMLSGFYQQVHAEHGVHFQLASGIQALEGKGGRVRSVRLSDNTLLPADLVIAGIGIEPAVAPLRAAGAAGKNGVDVDVRCRTSLPDIFALGDCAAHENQFADGQRIRLESVQNATDQAITVAKEIMGQGQDYFSVPWFWSNQYDLRLQTVGLSIGYDECLVRGDMAQRKFSIIYLRQGRVIALDCVNAPADFAQGRVLLLARAKPDREILTNAALPLKACLG
ncbi:NAD(P)/FAD-dependent oxidoreductase [Massilia cavernae]|uniref:NAD(P)/FAD-dependent oxidoreductase n=1 Tax=Massilia cavernae TaxID=2320864 RepID=A0A418XFW6_9BURK|nr:FAD-dependent oxidoreductase [Massilia cavernae]RJG11349.1 NAD(P)/FAD-dependent oxidoreductase [Massilia cavernae]